MTDFIPEFLLLALVAGLLISLIAGPLGAFIVWRRMSYFGDTLAHSALLGVAIGLILGVNITFAVIALCFALALGLTLLQQQKQLATDTLLGILSHLMLALGLLVIASMDDMRIDLNSYLFGDMLTLTVPAVIVIAVVVTIIGAILLRYWNQLLMITTNEELAQVHGINVARMRLLLMLMTSMMIAISMRAVGVLLITSLLIIPAASARFICKTPEQMAIYAIFFAMFAVIFGLLFSFYSDLPAGPSIVVTAGLGFFIVAAVGRSRSL